MRPPGPDNHLVVTTDTHSLIAWHSGKVSLGTAQRSGRLRVEGPPTLVAR